MADKPKVFFIAGTDTGVGKSLLTASLLFAVSQKGLSTLGLKPVAAGSDDTSDGLRNEDAVLLQRYSSVTVPYEQLNPVCLRMAVAPHIAAEKEGRRLDAARLEGICRASLMQRADLTLIEGAGGWRVPINGRQHLSDLVVMLNIPVILVVGVRLGCINHALLTAEAIRADGVRLAGWIANEIDPQMPCIDENIASIEARINASCLARIPYQLDSGNAVPDVAAAIDTSVLLSL